MTKVKFAASPNTLAVAYTPGEIKAFGYDNHNVHCTISFNATLGDSSFNRTCFARHLVSGYYNLYAYTENEATYFVVKHGDSTLLPLLWSIGLK